MIGISERSVKTILKHHLDLRNVKSRLVAKTLNFLEKRRRIDVCEAMLSDLSGQAQMHHYGRLDLALCLGL